MPREVKKQVQTIKKCNFMSNKTTENVMSPPMKL